MIRILPKADLAQIQNFLKTYSVAESKMPICLKKP